MALVVTIAGVNWTSVTVDGSVYVEQRAADFISVCGLRIVDVNAAINIAAEAAILLDDDVTGEVFFNGRVIDIRYTLFGECASRYIDIKCQDLSYQLNETVIDQVEEFPGGAGHGAITADADIIDHLFDDYLPAVDSVAHVDILQDPLTITFNPCTLRNMLSQICTRTGGYFYIDFDDELHYFDAEAAGVAWWLTSDPVRDAPATNLITNPSIEVNTAGWTLVASTISRDTTYSVFGDAALKVITDDAAAGEGVRAVTTAETAINTEYTCSVYLRGTGTVRIFFFDTNGGVQFGDVITLTSVWTRYELTRTYSDGAVRQVGFTTNVQQGITYYCDGFQLETAALASSYFDGSFGADFAWTGAAHASTSTRGAGGTSYLVQDLDKATTATTVLDGVFIIGSEVSGWRGIHAPGDRQGIARDNRITTAQGIIDRGDAVLSKYGAAQVVYTVATYQAGLRAGYDILFICEIWDVNGTFTVRKMVVRWDGCGTPYYTLTLGAVVNPSLISERSWIDGLTDSVTVTAPMLPTSSRGWSQDLVFSATDHNTVAWAGGGEIILADGTVYTINAGNTGNMVAISYIYLDLDIADNALQTTDDAAVAVGSRILLVAVAQDVAAGKNAIFQTFGGEGQGVLVTADHIAAGTVTANEIAANTILAGNIAAGAIETDELDALAVTAAKIAANTITADKISMGLGDALFNLADGLLLLNPHCEISTTEWWSARKQLATLSGAFHRETGRWLGTRGLVVEEATTNLCKEPSFETALAFWAGVNATDTQDATYSRFGDYALKLVTDDAGAGEGASYNCTDTTAAATEYTLSVWMRGTGTVRLVFWDAVGGFQYSSVFTLTGVWTRYQTTKTFGAGAARLVSVWTNIQQAITFYCDGFQLEEQDYATSYADGDQGTGYAWTGAAHGSTSTRTVTVADLSAHVGLISDNNTLSFRFMAQMPYDADAAWPGGTNAFLLDTIAGADNFNRFLLSFEQAFNRFRVYINGGNRLVTGGLTFKAGDWLDIVVTFDFTGDDYNLYINGLLIDNDTTALAAPTGLDAFYLGSTITPSSQGGFNIDEFAVFDRVLTAIEIAGLYAMDRPMVDMGAMDKPGIYILDGRFRIASSTTGNRIDITADEIAGYDGAGVLQFELRSSDGKAVAGGGAVVLDENGLYTVGDGVDSSEQVRFLYDDAGTLVQMGHVYGGWGGAGAVVAWLAANCDAGDPWAAAGSKVILAAIDTVAGDDTRIAIESGGLISVGGTQLQLAGTTKLHLEDPAEIEFDGTTGNNLIEVVDNLADALHASDAGGLEYTRIDSRNAQPIFYVNPGAANIDFIVASDNEANLLRVDAGEDEVRMGDWDTNYSAFEVDGTFRMVGTATVFNDVYIPTTVGKLGGANTPTWEAFIDVTEEYTFAVGDLIHLPAVEIPHSYKEGSDIKIHCHIVTNGSDVGDADVRYEIVYTIGDMGETMGAAVGFASLDITIDGGTADRHHKYIFIGTIPGAGLKVGAALKMRFNRKVLIGAGDPPTDDPFVLMVGVHVEEDTVGSRTLLAK